MSRLQRQSHGPLPDLQPLRRAPTTSWSIIAAITLPSTTPWDGFAVGATHHPDVAESRRAPSNSFPQRQGHPLRAPQHPPLASV